MEQKLKIKIGIVIFIATCTELLLIIPIILKYGIPTNNIWYTIIGTLGIIVGISFSYIILILPLEYLKNKNLRLAIIMNPGFTLIFAGITIMLLGLSMFKSVFVLSGFLAVLCFIVGYVLFMFYFIRMRDGTIPSNEREK